MKSITRKLLGLGTLSCLSYTSPALAFTEFNWSPQAPDVRSQRLCPEASANAAGLADKIHINCDIEGENLTQNTAAAKEALTVMSYNIERGHQLSAQLDYMRNDAGAPKADVILLSEVDRGCERTGYQNIAREWAEALDMYYVYGVEWHEVDDQCEHGNAILSRYPMGDVEVTRFQKASSYYVYNTSDELRVGGRMVISAKLKVGDKYIDAYSTHLASRLTDDAIREGQAGEIITQTGGSFYNTIVGGDMNTFGQYAALLVGSHSDVLDHFVDFGLEDAHRGISAGDRGTANKIAGTPQVLDYIFAKNGTTDFAGICPESRCGSLSDHLPVWASVKVTGPADAEYSNWMGTWLSDRPETRLRDIVIPGTHDSGTYEISADSPLAPGASGWYKLATGVVANFAKTQHRNTYEQLNNGIRYLDLRVGRHNNQFVIVHGMVSVALSTVLDEVSTFVADHPKEIILLDFQQMSDSHYTELQNLIDNKLGNKLVPDSFHANSLTLGELWGSGKNVIALMQHDNFANSRENYWSRNGELSHTWPNVTNYNAAHDILTGALDNQDMNRFYVSQIIYTPEGSDVANSFLPGYADNLEELQENLKKAPKDWISEWKNAGKAVNIVITDFYERTSLVQTAIAYNARRHNLTGNWSNSAGQNAYHSNNPRSTLLINDSGTVTIELASNDTNAYLYLLDVHGNLIAQNDDGANGTNSRISLHLAAGQYQLIAATNNEEQSGEYQLKTSKGRLSKGSPQPLPFRELEVAGRCVDAAGTANGANVQRWDCNASDPQKWVMDYEGRLHSKSNYKLCADVSTGNTDDGSNIHLWECHGGDNQRWTWDGSFIRSAMDGHKTMDGGGNNGNNIHLWGLNGTAAQIFTSPKPWSYLELYKELMSQGQCLDVSGGNTGNGTNIQLWSCNGSDAQKWFMDEKNFVRSKLNTNKCLDLSGSNTSNGNNIHLWDCNGSNAQRWIWSNGSLRSAINQNKAIDSAGANNNVHLWDAIEGVTQQHWQWGPNIVFKKLKSQGRCLDVASANTANGTNIQTVVCHDHDAQYFYMDSLGRIHSKLNYNRCLDMYVRDNLIHNGNNVRLWDCNNYQNQRWVWNGSSLRSAVNANKAMDSAGANGSVHMWDGFSPPPVQQAWMWD